MQELKISLAPLQGFTDRFYRQAYAKCFQGVDTMYTPYVSYHKREIKKSTIKDVLPASEAKIHTIPQVLGNQPEEIIECASMFQDLGYDEINWNLGCPYPMVAKKQKGSGLLPYPEKIQEILEAVFEKITIKFSVKMRLGYEDVQDIHQLIPILNRFPLSEIILHARTGKQLYKGLANKDLFCEHAPKLNAPLCYNGDIENPEQWSDLQLKIPQVKALMIGRGILKDVFLPSKIKGLGQPSSHDKKDILVDFHNEMIRQYEEHLNGPGHMLNKMLAFWEYFSFHFEDQHKVFKMIKKCSSYQKYPGVVGSIFATKNLKE